MNQGRASDSLKWLGKYLIGNVLGNGVSIAVCPSLDPLSFQINRFIEIMYRGDTIEKKFRTSLFNENGIKLCPFSINYSVAFRVKTNMLKS